MKRYFLCFLLLMPAAVLTPAYAQVKINPAPSTPAAKPSAASKPAAKPAVEKTHQEMVTQINGYWNAARFGVADFEQVAPNGKKTKGKLYFQKPGLLHFEYAAPSTIEVVADGKGVAVRDKKLNTQDVYSLSQTPLQFLLADRIDVGRDKNVTSIAHEEDALILNLEEKKAIGGTHKLQILFDAKDSSLKEWIVTDAQGNETQVNLKNINISQKPNAARFKIDYTDYSKGTGN